MRRRRLLAILVSAALVVTACGSPSAPLPFSYSGTWAGSMVDSFAGNGTTTLTVSQSGSDIVGTWQAIFAAGNNGGTLAGTISGNDVLVELYPSDPTACPYAVVAQRSGTTLSGTYAAYSCTQAITGTVSVVKQ